VLPELWYVEWRSHPKFDVDVVEAHRVIGQLLPDVLGGEEDGLEVEPGALHLKPDADDLVGVAEAHLGKCVSVGGAILT
jgi:hypothetical protein